jgi:hypothetical protein
MCLAVCSAVALVQGCAGYGTYDAPPPPTPTVLEGGGVRVYVNQSAPATCTRLGTASLTAPGMPPLPPVTQGSVVDYAGRAADLIRAQGGNAGSLYLNFRMSEHISAPTYGLWPAGNVVVNRC